MNKGRSKMFTQKMKGVFKSRSLFDSGSAKIPGNLDCVTKESGKRRLLEEGHNNKHAKNSYFDHKTCNSFPSLYPTIAQTQKDKVRPSAKFTHTRRNRSSECMSNENDPFITVNKASPIEALRKSGCSSSHEDEFQKKENIINESCHFCHHDLSLNRGSGDVIYDQGVLSQRSRLDELNLNNNNESLRRDRKHYGGDLGMCHYCLKQICICGNNNLISTNNNYILKPSHTGSSDSSYFNPVLQYAFGKEKTNRNDFIILALGIHHYIKEVFNALDSNNNGFVHHEDLRILCTILGKDLKALNKSTICSSRYEKVVSIEQSLCANNSCEIHLHFAKFSEIISDKFSDLSDSNWLEKRKNTQLVNAVVNVTRRNESLNTISKQLEELETDYLKFTKKSAYSTFQNAEGKVNENTITKERPTENVQSNTTHLENIKLQKIILQQQQELQCLREVIEDLRVSLQCSDAENLSLKVREVKMQQFSIVDSSSEDECPRYLSSSEDERDSIDKLISDFPSSEQITMNSNESLLLSMESLPLSIPNSITPTPLSVFKDIKKVRSEPPKHKILQDENDLTIENEMQNVYESLSETKSELEETRTDLEKTVTEIQNKDFQLKRVNEILVETKQNLSKSIIENTNLKQRFVTFKTDEKNKNLKLESVVNELERLKSEIVNKDQEIISLFAQVKNLQTQRKRDIEALSSARTIIAAGVAEARRNEEALRKLLGPPSANSTPVLDQTPPPALPKPTPPPTFDTNKTSEKSPAVRYSTLPSNLLSNYRPTAKTLPKTCPPPTLDPNKTPAMSPLRSYSTLPSMLLSNYHQCDKNNNKTVQKKFKNYSNSNYISLSRSELYHNRNNTCFSNNNDNCNFDAMKGKTMFTNCSGRYKNSGLSCVEVKCQTEENSRLNPSPCEIRRSEFDCKSSYSPEAKTEAEHPFSGANSRPPAKFPVEKSRLKPSNDVTSGSRVMSPISSLGEADKPTLEVKPNLIKPIAITKPLSIDPWVPVSCYDSQNWKGREIEFSSKLRWRHEKALLEPPEDCGGNFESESLLKKSQPKTSTQILEGLEAEVEFLRKSLEEDPVWG